MGISRREVEENNLISLDVLEYIPKRCECGAPIAFTDTLRQIYCTNDKCFYKVAARLEAMAKKMRGADGECCDGWGESTCIEVCKYYKLKSPFQVFLVPAFISKGYKAHVADFDNKVDSICNPKLRKVELWKVAEYAGIPGIDSIANKIFGSYKTFIEAYEDIEDGEVPFIANKLGLRSSESSVMAVNTYNTLLSYKDELLFGERQFEIYRPEGEVVNVAITGGVEGYRNKGEFIQNLNKRYNGKYHFNLMNSVTSKIDILVADGDTSSNKFKTANRLNEKYKLKSREMGEEKDVGGIHIPGELIFIGTSEDVIRRLDTVTQKGRISH